MSKVLEDRVAEFKKRPGKALFTLSLPTVLGMLVQIAYMLADMAFIGRLGIDALAAVTFSFPVLFFLFALVTLVTAGATTLIAQRVGARKYAEAGCIATDALANGFLMSLGVLLLGIFFTKPLLSLLGATPTVTNLGVEYLLPLFIAGPFLFFGDTFAAILIGEGNTKLPTIVRVGAALLNIALDALFIIGFGWGVRGAALATAVSFFAESCALAIIVLVARASHVKLCFRTWKSSWKRSWESLRIGGPISLAQILMSTSFTIFNAILAPFGTVAIAAYGLIRRLDSVLFFPTMGLSIALVTLVGIFKGAKEYALVKRVVKQAIIAGLLYSVFIALFFYTFPTFFLGLLTDETAAIALATRFLHIEVFTFPFFIVGFLLSRTLVGYGDGLASLVVTGMRLLLVAVPLAWFFTTILGYGPVSVIVAGLLSGLASTLTAVLWYRWRLAKDDVAT